MPARDGLIWSATAIPDREPARELAGWAFRRVGAIDPVPLANVKRLAGYRHPRNHRESVASELTAVFASRSRGRGVARALIEWVTQAAEERGAASFYWHTPQDSATARALYDKVARFRGVIVYSRQLNASQSSVPR
jgi:GNAT superfamily N-acetyltransferase